MEDYTKYLKKMSLKKDDILLIVLPKIYDNSEEKRNHIHKWIASCERLLPYKNKVIVIPEDIELKVIEKDDQKLLGEEWCM